MKTIKFRAWDENQQRMIYYSWSDLIRVLDTNELRENTRSLHYITKYDWSPQMRMQFIGKHDMDGVDIYESDIVYKELCDPDDPACGYYGATGVIEEDQFGMGWVISAVDDDDKSFYDHMGCNFSFSEIKIIGNKYKNPELLE